MSAELVAIELQLKGYEGVMSDFRTLDQMLNSLRGRKNRLIIESNLQKAKADVIAYRAEVEKLERELAGISKGHKEGNTWIRNPEWSEMNGKLQEARENLKRAKQAVTEFQYALRNLAGESFMQTFNKISSAVAHIGSAFQSAGNALTKLTNPFANFTKGIVMGAGYQALNKFTSGLENGFNRYDTMKKYPKIMESFGYSNEEAEKSINALDQSVRGLPTGLDEMVDMAQRFTATTGNITKGTKLAIAANNAFLASMSTDTQKYQGMMQLQDVLGGKDMNSREWNSLVSSMTPAIVKMGEAMKKSGEWSGSMADFIQTVRDGKMDNQEFIDQLIKIGNEGGVLEKMAQESKNTWQAFFANIGNAASRMTAGVIQALDEVSQQMTSKDVNQFLADTVIPGIDGMTESVKKWIKAHPKEISDFFKSLGKINFKSLAQGFCEAVLGMANLVKSVSDIVGDRDLSGIGKFMLWGNALGKAMTIFGGLLKGSRHGFAFFGASLKTILQARKHGGLMGMLTTAFLGDDVKKTEKAIETAANVAPKAGKFSTGLSKFFVGWSQVAAMIGGSAFTAWGSMKLIKGAVNSFKETVEILNEVDWDMGKKALAGIGGFLGSVATLSSIAGHFASASGTVLLGELVVGLFTTLATGFADLDSYFIKDTLKNLADATSYFEPLSKNLKAFKGIAIDSKTKNNLREAVSVLNDVNSIFRGEFNPDKKQFEGGLKNFGDGYADSLKNIKEVTKLISDLSNMKVDTVSLGNFASTMSNALVAIDNMLLSIPAGLGDEGTIETTGNLSSITANLKSAFASLIGEDGILNQIPQIVSKVKEMTADPELDQLNQFKVQMANLGSAMEEAYKGLQGKLTGSGDIMQRVTNFADAVYQARRVIYHLGQLNTEASSVDISGGVGVIETTVSQLKAAFGSKKIGELKVEISNFVTSIKTALSTIKQVGTEPVEIDAQVKLSSGFYSSVSDVVADINDAADDVRSAFRSIPNSLFKTIQVTISANVDTSGAVSAINQGSSLISGIANGVYGSTGGRISRSGVLYRSGGGKVFRPKGIDRVPAMLAEGEYVHRKQAVDFFGMDFMRSVNAMDVKGAMNALMTKAGASVGASRQSIVNNTVNNNQRVNLTISSDNPNYVGMQMGRFVGAL